MIVAHSQPNEVLTRDAKLLEGGQRVKGDTNTTKISLRVAKPPKNKQEL